GEGQPHEPKVGHLADHVVREFLARVVVLGARRDFFARKIAAERLDRLLLVRQLEVHGRRCRCAATQNPSSNDVVRGPTRDRVAVCRPNPHRRRSPPPVILLRGVSLVYPNGTRALDGIDLDIEKGSFVFLVGHSGTGKSSLLRLLYRESLPTT